MWGLIVNGITSFLGKREERKTAKQTLQAKVQLNRDNNDAQVVFNNQEWDLLSKSLEGGSWKDEYLTIVMTLPLITLFLSVFFGVLFTTEVLVDAANQALTSFKDLVPNYQELLGLTIVAGLGLKAYKK